jgi:hypothetical protein
MPSSGVVAPLAAAATATRDAITQTPGGAVQPSGAIIAPSAVATATGDAATPTPGAVVQSSGAVTPPSAAVTTTGDANTSTSGAVVQSSGTVTPPAAAKPYYRECLLTNKELFRNLLFSVRTSVTIFVTTSLTYSDYCVRRSDTGGNKFLSASIG